MKGLPFFVRAANEATLYRLQDGRFQIVVVGSLAPLLTGPGYILVTERFCLDVRRPYLFVSPELCRKLSQEFPELIFSKGFSGFERA